MNGLFGAFSDFIMFNRDDYHSNVYNLLHVAQSSTIQTQQQQHFSSKNFFPYDCVTIAYTTLLFYFSTLFSECFSTRKKREKKIISNYFRISCLFLRRKFFVFQLIAEKSFGLRLPIIQIFYLKFTKISANTVKIWLENPFLFYLFVFYVLYEVPFTRLSPSKLTKVLFCRFSYARACILIAIMKFVISIIKTKIAITDYYYTYTKDI